LPQPTLHLALHHHVLGGLGNVQKPVDPLPGEGRQGRGQIGIFESQIERAGHGIDRRSNQGVIHNIVNAFAK